MLSSQPPPNTVWGAAPQNTRKLEEMLANVNQYNLHGKSGSLGTKNPFGLVTLEDFTQNEYTLVEVICHIVMQIYNDQENHLLFWEIYNNKKATNIIQDALLSNERPKKIATDIKNNVYQAIQAEKPNFHYESVFSSPEEEGPSTQAIQAEKPNFHYESVFSSPKEEGPSTQAIDHYIQTVKIVQKEINEKLQDLLNDALILKDHIHP